MTREDYVNELEAEGLTRRPTEAGVQSDTQNNRFAFSPTSQEGAVAYTSDVALYPTEFERRSPDSLLFSYDDPAYGDSMDATVAYGVLKALPRTRSYGIQPAPRDKAGYRTTIDKRSGRMHRVRARERMHAAESVPSRFRQLTHAPMSTWKENISASQANWLAHVE